MQKEADKVRKWSNKAKGRWLLFKLQPYSVRETSVARAHLSTSENRSGQSTSDASPGLASRLKREKDGL